MLAVDRRSSVECRKGHGFIFGQIVGLFTQSCEDGRTWMVIQTFQQLNEDEICKVPQELLAQLNCYIMAAGEGDKIVADALDLVGHVAVREMEEGLFGMKCKMKLLVSLGRVVSQGVLVTG